MGTKITLPILLLFYTASGFAQTRKQIQGKVVAKDANVSEIAILNLNTQQEVATDLGGDFSIGVQPNDVLVFASPNFYYLEKTIIPIDFVKSPFIVQLVSKPVLLDEVEIVDTKKYNAVDLGILQKPAKTYTPAERRLYTAGDFKPIHLLGLLGGSLQLDPIFNAINGKTKRLKKEIILEKNARRLVEFHNFFPDEELIKALKMEQEHIADFIYSVLNKKEFKSLLECRDKNQMTFYLIEQHRQFKIKSVSNEK